MRQWKKGGIILSVGLLVSCSMPFMGSKEEKTDFSMYQLPEKVDLEKAAHLNVELGLGYLEAGQIPRAKSKLTRARVLAPHLPEVHYAMGYFQERTGEMDNAEKSYLKAISLNPRGGNEHNNYGAFLCRQHQYHKAEKEFLKAVLDQSYLNTAEVYENAGLCVMQIPDFPRATEHFEKALRYDANRPKALLELALLHYRTGKWQESREHHTRYLALAKHTSRSLLLGIELAKRAGDRDKVASYELLLRSQFPEAKTADLMKVANYHSPFHPQHPYGKLPEFIQVAMKTAPKKA